MLFSRSLVTLILAVVVLGAPTFKRDASTVESDIEGVATGVASLDKDIKAFPNSGGTFLEAYKIHKDAMSVATSIQYTTEAVEDSDNFTDAEAASINDKFSELADEVVTACDNLVTKKPGIDEVHLQPVASSDLEDLKNKTDKLWEATEPKTPASYQDSMKQSYNKANEALVKAITAFDS